MIAIVEDHPETAQTLVDSVLHTVDETAEPGADGENQPISTVPECVEELGDYTNQ